MHHLRTCVFAWTGLTVMQSLQLQKILDPRAIILAFPPEFRSQTKAWCLVVFLFPESVTKSHC